jgi:hypothetical protein
MKKPRLPRPQVMHSTQYVRSSLGFRLPVSKVSDMTDHATNATELLAYHDINVMIYRTPQGVSQVIKLINHAPRP